KLGYKPLIKIVTFEKIGHMKFVLLFAGILLFTASCHRADHSAEQPAGKHPTLAIGSAAPDFSLTGVDGKTYSLASFSGAKVLVVVFTCNHCPTAQAYEDRIVQMTRDYADKGVAVVAIMPNDPRSIRLDELGYTEMGDSFEEMKRRAADKHFNF